MTVQTSDFLIRPGNFAQNRNGEWHVFYWRVKDNPGDWFS